MASLRRVHLIGHSGAGKTTLGEDLIRVWRGRRLRVGAIKHTGHVHELDHQGKDSWRLRESGAEPVAIVTQDRLALHRRLRADEDPYLLLASHFADCDLLLIESHKDAADALRLEVWRAVLGKSPLALGREGVSALITDDPPPAGWTLPVWSRHDLGLLSERILQALGLSAP